jgi:hypothetical protein
MTVDVHSCCRKRPFACEEDLQYDHNLRDPTSPAIPVRIKMGADTFRIQPSMGH